MLASGATGFYDSAGNASSKLNDGHIAEHVGERRNRLLRQRRQRVQ
jgi:hypothetical protein